MSEEDLQIAEKRGKRQRRKVKIYPSECRVSKKSKERSESLLTRSWCLEKNVGVYRARLGFLVAQLVKNPPAMWETWV